jgi:UDP-N-acetylmuramate--alanine ligase
VTDQPLAGRRLYFVGIGGAGLSAYANFARAWGAEVRGWDVRETIFLEALDGIEVDIGGEPSPPDGYEVVVSTAHLGRIEGQSRAEFLAELVSLRRAIVVGGAHGKTTTSAMIAYVLRELGHDPSWIVGGVVPQLGGNAGVGEGWLVVEGDESDRSIALLRADIGVVTNVELDHHATYASEAELASFSPVPVRSCAAGTSLRSSWSFPFRESTTARMLRQLSPRSSSPASRGPTPSVR